MENRILILILVICLLPIIYKFYNISQEEEHFCPTALTIENDKYILWNTNKVNKIFNNYSDYLKYYHNTQANYNNKCKFCKPLKAVSKSHLKISNDAMQKNWADTTMSPKWFNVEYFSDGSKNKKKRLKMMKNRKKTRILKKTIKKGINLYLEKHPNCSETVNGKIVLKAKYMKIFNKILSSKGLKNSISNLVSKLIKEGKILKKHIKNNNINKIYNNNDFVIGLIQIVANLDNCEILYKKHSDTKETQQESDVIEEEISRELSIKSLAEAEEKIQEVVNKETTQTMCKCYNSYFEYIPESKSCKNTLTGKLHSICSDTSIKPVAESIVVEETGNGTRQNIIKQISKWKDKWLIDQPKCLKMIENKNKTYYNKLITSYSNYMASGFKRLIGYIPDVNSEDNMSFTELNTFLTLLKNMPKCDKLINTYYKSIDTSKPPVVPHEDKKSKKPTIKTTSTINLGVKKPSIPSIATITTVSSVKNTPVKEKNTFDQQIDSNRGKRTSNPFGSRKINPDRAPYQDYIKKIGNKLATIELKINEINDQKSATEKATIENMQYLQQEKKLKDQIKDDKEILEHERKLYQKANNKDFSALKHNAKERVVDNEHKKFAYKNSVKFDHLEPTKKIASAYGWSYMPPQYWSVPQKRPPVCLPQQGHENTVKPILDKGVPVDALDYTQVGSILPKFEYSEVYNPEYYHPGWKAQDKANYPKFEDGKNFSNKYYNYNLAEDTSKHN